MVSGQYAALFIVGFFVYIGLMILIAYLTSKKGTTQGEDYLMGGRNVGLLLLICTAAATAVGTGTSVGATANGFRDGWLGAVYPLANAIGLVTVAFCFSHVRKHKFRTLCEELQFYYDGSPYMRKFMSVVIFIVSIVWVGSAINGGANYLAYLIGMDMIPAKIITVLAFGVYVFVGGYMAVVWTDAIQAVLLFGGFVTIAILAIPAAGGFDTIRATYEAAGNPGAMTAFGVGSKGVLGVLAVALASYYGAMAGLDRSHARLHRKEPQNCSQGHSDRGSSRWLLLHPAGHRWYVGLHDCDQHGCGKRPGKSGLYLCLYGNHGLPAGHWPDLPDRGPVGHHVVGRLGRYRGRYHLPDRRLCAHLQEAGRR